MVTVVAIFGWLNSYDKINELQPFIGNYHLSTSSPLKLSPILALESLASKGFFSVIEEMSISCSGSAMVVVCSTWWANSVTFSISK